MHTDDATLSARLRQIAEEAPGGLMTSTFLRAQQVIMDTYAADCDFLAYSDGGLATCYGPDAMPDPHGQELVRDKALFREVWRQMIILQGPENTPPSARMTAEEVDIWNRHRAGEAWAAALTA